MDGVIDRWIAWLIDLPIGSAVATYTKVILI